MQVNVLGPLDVREHDRSITPTATKPRQVFALLAMHAGEVVSIPALHEELWGATPPHTSVQTLQTYILQLRRGIDGASHREAGKKVLATRPYGYLLDISSQDVDVHQYDRLANAGHRAAGAGDYESASRLLRLALEVWRGPALVDVRRGVPLEIAVNGLEETRLGVLESRIEADLRLGRHHMLLGELAELTTRFPMHERLCSQYMVAQYRSGRQWRALEIFHMLRRTLVEELGVEPSPRTQHLLRAILKGDPMLDELRLDTNVMSAVG